MEPISEQKVIEMERSDQQKESVLQMGTMRSFSHISQTEDGTNLMEDDGELDQPEESLNIALYETLIEHEEAIVNALSDDAFRSSSTLYTELTTIIKKKQLFAVEDLRMIAVSLLADIIVPYVTLYSYVGSTQNGGYSRRVWQKNDSAP